MLALAERLTRACAATLRPYLRRTGKDKDLRATIERQVRTHGGTYTGNMTREGTTHLVAEVASGKKYEAAVKWGIPIASRQWLTACIEARGMFAVMLSGGARRVHTKLCS